MNKPRRLDWTRTDVTSHLGLGQAWAVLPQRLALLAAIWVAGAIALSGAHVIWPPIAPQRSAAPLIKRPVKARVPVPLRSVGGDAGEPLVALDKARTSMVSAVSMQGADVLDNSKKKIGVVSDVLVNSASGSATAVVRLGNAIGAGAKHIAVPFSELKVKSNGSRLEAVVEFGRGAIESFPDFKATQ